MTTSPFLLLLGYFLHRFIITVLEFLWGLGTEKE
jgi:hypothetical protein